MTIFFLFITNIFVNSKGVIIREHLLESLTKNGSCRSWIRMDQLRYFLTGDLASLMIRMSMTPSVNPLRTAWSCIRPTDNTLPSKTYLANYWPGLYVPSTFTNKIIISYLKLTHMICFLFIISEQFEKNTLFRTVIFWK